MHACDEPSKGGKKTLLPRSVSHSGAIWQIMPDSEEEEEEERPLTEGIWDNRAAGSEWTLWLFFMGPTADY